MAYTACVPSCKFFYHHLSVYTYTIVDNTISCMRAFAWVQGTWGVHTLLLMTSHLVTYAAHMVQDTTSQADMCMHAHRSNWIDIFYELKNHTATVAGNIILHKLDYKTYFIIRTNELNSFTFAFFYIEPTSTNPIFVQLSGAIYK